LASVGVDETRFFDPIAAIYSCASWYETTWPYLM